MARKTKIQLRRDTAANWTSANPTLAAGEFGWESDTNKLKIGDGSTAWTSLGYFGGTATSPLTTKGDVYGHSTVDARIPVGTDNQVLVADSAQTLGLKWATVPSSSGGALTQLSTTTLGGTATNVDITSISGSYSALRLVMVGRGDTAATVISVNITFNADTGANYVQNAVRVASGTVTGNIASAQTSINAAGLAAGTATANLPGIIILDIPFYASTTFNKIVHINNSWSTGTTANDLREIAGLWNSTAAISRITLTASTGNFIAGTQVVLYGLS